MPFSKTARNPAFLPSGFFVLRTPLLPIDELLNWSDSLEAPAAMDDPPALERALAADHERLRGRLVAAMSRPEIREALFVASPDLEERFELWTSNPESERGRGIEQAMVRYFLRMAGRATPFGLCAGCSVGTVGDATRLVLEGHPKWLRHTRLDMDYLHALTEEMARDPKLRNVFTYRPNSTLYHAAGRLRYAESQVGDKERTYHLVAVDETDALTATLAAARDGAAFADLAAALADEDVTQAEADDYVARLIENQILVPDIALFVTGAEPTPTLIEQFSKHAATAPVAEALGQMRTQLDALDATGIGNAPGRYRAAAKLLADLPGKVELSRLFQVDLVKPASQASLGGPVLAEIMRGVDLLSRLARFQLNATDELARFREAFAARYEQRSVPLVEALDGEAGIGFPVSRGIGGDASPLLKGLAFPSASGQMARWEARENLLLRKLSDALQRGSQEIFLEGRDFDEMALPEPPPLPDAFATIATVAAATEAALAAGDFRVVLTGAGGPSGATLLGRFCHVDPEMLDHVKSHLRAEEALRPDAVFAEIVHLPDGRMGNVLARPVLRDHEIPYLGRSGAAAERQIPVTDLHLAMRGDRLVLFSERLGREVIPRLTNAHNFSLRSLALYRFLCTLQSDGTTAVGWDWGALQNAPFLPRVSTGKLVLSRARWCAGKEELRRLGKSEGADQFREVQTWRRARRLPRLVALADGDNELTLDLDNVLCIEVFVDMVKARDEATLIEVFPTPDLHCASGPEGHFVHELVIPFVRTKREEPPQSELRSPQPVPPSFRRSFAPGSEWLYAKLYTGTTTADRMLTEVIAPLVGELLESRAADSWFFIRHGDPDPHLRLRFHGNPDRLHDQALPALEAATAPLLRDGTLWRMQFDTYEREVERYGGPEGITLAEQLFQLDSEAALKILDQLEPGNEGLDERWRLTLRSMDLLIADFGFDIETKTKLLDQLRDAFAKEFRRDARLAVQLGERFRKERSALEALLDPAHKETNLLAPGVAILDQRSARLVPIVAELKACERAGRLTVPITNLAGGFFHMTANRLLRSAQRAQELVLYDFLARLYDSQSKRR